MASLIPGILTHIYVSHGRIWLGYRSWRCCKEGSSVFRYWFCVQCSRRPDFDIEFQVFEGLQRRTPMVAGDWGAKSVVISTASPLRSSLPLLRRPRRSPMLSSPYPMYWRKKCLFIGIHDTDLPVMICRYGLYICSSVLHFWLTRDPSGRVKSAPAKEVYLRALDLICQWLGFYLHSIGDFTHHWVKSPLEANKILGKFYLILLEILLG